MSAPSARLLVLVGDKFACVRIIGRASFASSTDLTKVINELRERGTGYFIFDLTECSLMDSTFLGVLAGFGLRMRSARPEPEEPAIELLNANPRITELLENLGVLHLFRATHGALNTAGCSEPQEQSPSNPSRVEVTRACLEAHKTLMAINPQNESKFKDVARFLAEDLKKSGA